MKQRSISVILAAVIALLVAAGSASAQHKWYGGLKFGFNSSQFRGDPPAPWVYEPSGGYYVSGTVADKMAGFIGGGFVRREMGRWLGLELQLLYSMKGGEGPVNGTLKIQEPSNVEYDGTINGQLKIHMDYIDMPLLAVFRFPKDEHDKIGFTAQLGPCIGYSVRTDARLQGSAEVPLPDTSTRVQNFDEEIPIQGDINKWAVSGVLGAALEFYHHKQTIILEGRYQFDVTSVSADQDTYNHVFSLMISFMAPIIN
ncbi:MAG: porin family protein [Candidatus Latescibacterota bacterium]|jgi:hypothetical protein